MKQETQYNAVGKHMQHMTQDLDVYGDRCCVLLSALVTGLGQIDGNEYDFTNLYSMKLTDRAISEEICSFMPHPSKSDRSFWFDGNILVSLTVTVHAVYEDVRDDVTSRLGVAPIESRVPPSERIWSPVGEDGGKLEHFGSTRFTIARSQPGEAVPAPAKRI